MTLSFCAAPRALIVLMLASFGAVAAHAQQAPITGQMLAPTAPPATVETTTPAAVAAPVPNAAASERTIENAPVQTQVGDTTRQLLSMQAQGTHAGKHLPIPGQEASASYQRYLKSFEHPIPEFYDAAVSKSTGASSTSDSP